ncbi:hypothetical protein E1301_Tti009039 [Triplophysa tibetana]|uniref:Uncharacterized protein n=1 Tax=Triplophysa tibetana TaxID=1572043 RepID=A0A5A9P2V3_9TELE|nr:hypothetical protein E1301_Tti009039 [Triplophysa tibetana]
MLGSRAENRQAKRVDSGADSNHSADMPSALRTMPPPRQGRRRAQSQREAAARSALLVRPVLYPCTFRCDRCVVQNAPGAQRALLPCLNLKVCHLRPFITTFALVPPVLCILNPTAFLYSDLDQGMGS